MSKQSHILIVDDDQGIRDLLSRFLQKHDYRITTVADGDEMFNAMEQHDFDLVILDIMLPKRDGIQLCQEIRKTSKVGIIMLTAMTEDIERIIGLEMGADDYLGKPFNPRELLARIKAILRRTNDPGSDAETQHLQPKEEIYSFANWKLNKITRSLVSPDGIEVTLSSGEYILLIAFVERPQQVLSRDQLLDITKNREAGPFDRSIDIQISRLRHKIEENPKNPQLIKTVRGGGYVLATIVEHS